jgi:hypothetical protein
MNTQVIDSLSMQDTGIEREGAMSPMPDASPSANHSVLTVTEENHDVFDADQLELDTAMIRAAARVILSQVWFCGLMPHVEGHVRRQLRAMLDSVCDGTELATLASIARRLECGGNATGKLLAASLRANPDPAGHGQRTPGTGGPATLRLASTD